jgi:hypothetical protein
VLPNSYQNSTRAIGSAIPAACADTLSYNLSALPRHGASDVIVRTLFRLLWVVLAFCLAVGIAAMLLIVFGAIWVGDELRAIAPEDPVLRDAAPVFGMVLFAGTIAQALTALPALLAVIVGEALGMRSWMYYVLAGGAAVVAIPLLASPDAVAALPSGQYMAIFAAAGFVGGFAYWLLAGRNA